MINTVNHLNLDENTIQASKKFLESLVQFLTGYSIEELPTDKREEVVLQAIKTYQDFLLNWLEKNKGKRIATQFKIYQKNIGQNNEYEKKIEDHFANDLEQALMQANQAFVDEYMPQ